MRTRARERGSFVETSKFVRCKMVLERAAVRVCALVDLLQPMEVVDVVQFGRLLLMAWLESVDVPQFVYGSSQGRHVR